MKRKINKYLSYFLVMVMLMTSSMTAMAEENTAVSGNDIIVIEEVTDETVSNNEVISDESSDEVEETEEETVQIPAEESTVSDNEVPTEEEELFPGLPEGYKLSAQDLEGKKQLGDTLEELGDLTAGKDYVEDEVVFVCETKEEAEAYAEAFGAELKSYSDKVGVIVLPKKATVMDAVKASSNARGNFPLVCPNYYRYAMSEVEDVIPIEEYNVSAMAFNDPMLNAANASYQWQHQVVGSTYAWSNGYTGKGVKVAVLDSGVSTHEDLVITNSYNAAAGATSGTGDEDGHGTHVSGIIAARNNNGKGGSGIAPDATLYNIKVLGAKDAEAGTSATLLSGINKAIEWKVDIMNMSLGGCGYSVLESNAIDKATNAGIAVFVAAGNDCAMTKMYPAAYPNSICVAATDTNNSRAFFSNYGSWVALSAPGVNIYSTVPGGYGVMSGTSQATPVAAGTAAVILSSGHAGLKDKNGAPLTGADKVAALKKIMTSNTVKVTGSKIGKGITSLPKALKLSVISGTPNATVFKLANGNVTKGGTFDTATVNVTIEAESGMTIYYTTDGKTPSFKNGVATGTKYTGAVTLNGEVNGKVTGKMTLKAIAVNAAGKVSKVASATFTFKPKVTGITISGLQEVVTGKNITLKAAVTPSWAAKKSVTWAISGDPKKTGVSINKSGKVSTTTKAVSGTYTVTATAQDGSGVSKTYSVKVLAAARIDTMKFSENSAKLERGIGQTTLNLSSKLTLKDAKGNLLANAGNVVWSSSKDSIASVNQSGVLTAKTAGTVTITATAADGSGKTAKIKVTIVQMAESITISGSATVAKGKSVTLKAQIGPSATKDKKVTWSISGNPDTTKVSVKNGKVTAGKEAQPGTYTITATTTNGKTATKTVKVVDPVTAIKFNKTSANIFRVAGKNGSAPTSTTFTLDVTGGYDAASLTVTNSAPSVVDATLSGKTLTVKAKGNTTGKATITVAATDGSSKKAKCTVNVVNPASNITISPAMGRSNRIAKDKTLKLSAVFEAEYGVLDKNSKKVQWSSSNEAFVTVDKSGVVKAKIGNVTGPIGDNFGEAVITAEALDGSGIKAQYVVKTEAEVTKLTIGNYFYNAVYDKISVNDAPMYRVYCNYSSTWFDTGVYPEIGVEVSNPDIASAFSYWQNNTFYLVVWPYKTGTVTVKVKPVDGSSANASIKVTITK